MSEILSGIYKIYCKDTNKYYIGQSINVKTRLNQHLSELKNNRHINKELQNDFNICGEKSFIFEKIKDVEEEFLNVFEKYYIEYYKAIQNGYNTIPINNLVRRNYGDSGNINIFEETKIVNISLYKADICAYETINLSVKSLEAIIDSKLTSDYLEKDIYDCLGILKMQSEKLQNKIMDIIELEIRRAFNKLGVSHIKYCDVENMKDFLNNGITKAKVGVNRKEVEINIKCAK